jgi:hypothetical protein
MGRESGMTDTADEAMEARPPTEAEKAYMRQVVDELVTDTNLHVREEAYELIIFNPCNLALGQIYVDFEEGHIAWRHVAFEYLGQLVGFEGDETRGTVTREEVVGRLR